MKPDSAPLDERRCEFCGSMPLTEKEKAHMVEVGFLSAPDEHPTPITDVPRGNESVTADQVRSRVERLFHSVNMSLVEWSEVANDLLGSATRITDIERQLAESLESKERILKRAEAIRCELVESERKLTIARTALSLLNNTVMTGSQRDRLTEKALSESAPQS